MTLHDLNQLCDLRHEVNALSERLGALQSRATATTSSLSGLPNAPGYSDKVGDYAVAMADLKEIISERLEQCVVKLREVEMYISNIDDSLTRQVMMYRFAYDMSWRDVAAQVGGGNTEDSVRKMCYRYLEKNMSQTSQQETL